MSAACVVTPPDKQKNIGGFCSIGSSAVSTASTVRPSNGNLNLSENDYSGNGAFPLQFTRSVNSSPVTVSGSVGKQWRHNYDQSVTLETLPETRVKAVRPDGKVYYFTPDGESWASSGDVTDRLVELTDGWQYITASGDRVEQYDASGRLTSVSDRYGRFHTLAYNADGNLESVTDDAERSLTFTYTSENRVATMTTPDSHSFAYTYDDYWRLVSVTLPDETPEDATDNPQRTYHYEDASLPYGLTGITDENGDRVATWTYDDQDRVYTSEAAGTVTETLVPNGNDSAIVTNALGKRTIYYFADILGVKKITRVDGQPTALCEATSRTTTYDANGFRDRVTDFNGNITDYDYDSRGLENQRIEALGTPQQRTITTQWHADFRLPTCRVEPGITTAFSYDATGLLTARSVTDTSDAGLFPDAASKACDAIAARPDLASLNRRTTTYTYTALALLDTVDGPRTDISDITGYDYDAQGNLTRVTNVLNQATAITQHDAHGNPLRVVDPNGLVTKMTYDPRQRLTSFAVGNDTDGYQTTTYTYDPVGNLTRVTLPDGSFLAYTYDAAHRLTDIADQLGNTIHYTLDAAGNRTQVDVRDPANALRNTHRYVYDEASRLRQSLGADKGVDTQKIDYTAYDANGNLLSQQDAAGNVTQYGYDALNRLVQAIDPLNGITQYGYDLQGNLTSVTDPRGNATTYTYDGFGNQTRVVSPDTGTTLYGHDLAGNLRTATDARGMTTVYEYDALNRLINVTFADASITQYSYDQGSHGKGRLTGVSDASGATAWTYDPLGRIASKTQTIGAVNLTTSYGYNAQGQLVSMTYPSGKVLSFSYTNGKVSGITVDGQPLLRAIAFEPFGPIKGWGVGASGPTLQRQYDLDGQLVQFPVAGTQRRIAYDKTGNIVALNNLTAPSDPQTNLSFGYDALDRLQTLTQTGVSETYGYDANGNRLSRNRNGQIDNYVTAAASNRLTGISGANAASYAYDAVGNIVNDGVNAFNYNAQNRLIGVNDNAAYSHNALGQRVMKSIATVATLPGDASGNCVIGVEDFNLLVNMLLGTAANDPAADCTTDGTLSVHDLTCLNTRLGATGGAGGVNKTLFVYDEAGQLIGEYDETGAVIQETAWLGNIPVAVLKSGNVYYIYPDHLNTPRAITNGTGSVVWEWPLDGFGVTAANDDPDGDGQKFAFNLRFPGQYFDQETGLHYNYFRDYNPATGRYVQSDPIGLDGGTNTYGYALQNPALRSDPTGLIVLPPDEVSVPLPGTDSCKASEIRECAARCAPAPLVGCYATVRWRIKGIRGGNIIRVEDRIVNCNCEELDCDKE